MCRICHSGADHDDKPLISPCLCLGSLKYVHVSCLQIWLRRSGKRTCELCQFTYIMATQTEPFCEWKRLALTSTQKIKIVLAVMSHAIIFGFTLTAVYWFLDRSADGTSPTRQWTFWKSAVLVGCLVAELFLVCVQCRIGLLFLKQWRSSNSVVEIENVPDTEKSRLKLEAKNGS
ncbi:hypothetical protein ACOMHN_041829 [Nucella lapillus]